MRKRFGRSAANKGIQWHLNPPLVAHIRGAHQTLIEVTKRATYAILFQPYVTVFAKAEALINSQPMMCLLYQMTSVWTGRRPVCSMIS